MSVGSLNAHKDFSTAIQSIHDCRDSGITLDIVGSGPLFGSLEQQIRELKLSERVRLLGSRNDMAELLKNYDIVMSTSKWEGFGLALVEGMATGLPVLAPRIPGISSIITHGYDGYLYEGTGDLLSGLKYFKDTERRKKLGSNAVKTSNRYSIEHTAEKYLTSYKRTILEK